MFEAVHPAIRTPSALRQKMLLWLTFLTLLAVSLLAFLSIQRLIESSTSVRERMALLVEVNQFMSGLKDVETGGRGYALSDGDERHLQRRSAGVDAVGASARRLRQLSANEPRLRREFEQVFILSGRRIAESARLVADRRDPAATRRHLLGGLVLMDQIRDRTGAILADQQQLYRAETTRLERQGWITSITLALGVTLCLAVIGWLFRVRGKEVDRRRQLEEQLRAFNLELEDRIQERAAELRRTRDLLDSVIENIPDMIVVKEASGSGYRYLLINAAGEKLIGRDRQDILGKTETDLFPPEEAAAIVESNRAVVASGAPRTLSDRTLTGESGVLTVETRMVPIANGKEGAMILAIVRDVSEARAREDQLRQLQRMDAIGRLTGGVAHDFNNLLAIIHGNSELLEGRVAPGSDEADMVNDVVGAARRGAELVRRLLAFARMQHLAPEAVDLDARIASIMGLLKRSLGERVEVRIKPSEGLWAATVDPTQVDDALVNLAINARDAMPGGGTLTIETRNVTLDEDYAAQHAEVTAGDYVMMAVSDTGTGMPPDVIARAFEPFFTTKAEGQGTGLGLSQIFGWVKQSGGHIKVYSELGHGTSIKLYLPRAEAVEASSPAVDAAVVPNGDETILVVEDNPSVRKTVLRQLHDLSYRTIEAASGAEALDLVRQGASFDLLLTDVIMPGGITGYQLAEQLRSERPDLKILFSSGYTELAAANEEVRNETLLSKPYSKQDLGRAVRSVLDAGKAGRPSRRRSTPPRPVT